MKIIINNESYISMQHALLFVSSVIDGGEISGSGDDKQYCYVSIFNKFSGAGPVSVNVTKNKESQTFRISDYIDNET